MSDFPYPDNHGQTHYEGCYRTRRHHNCAVAEIERLRADCKDKQRIIETQKQYLANKDSVIKGMNEMISRLRSVYEAAKRTAKECAEMEYDHTCCCYNWALLENSQHQCGLCELRDALKEHDDVPTMGTNIPNDD